jgi:hypothetical protein
MRWNPGFMVAISNKCRPCVALSRRQSRTPGSGFISLPSFASLFLSAAFPEIVPPPYLPGATGHGHMLDWSVAPLTCGVNGIDLGCMHDRIKDTGYTGELTPLCSWHNSKPAVDSHRPAWLRAPVPEALTQVVTNTDAPSVAGPFIPARPPPTPPHQHRRLRNNPLARRCCSLLITPSYHRAPEASNCRPWCGPTWVSEF